MKITKQLSFFLLTLIGFIKGKTIDIDKKDIVIASLQSLSMKDYDDGIFNGFGTLIVDEVHHTSAQVFNKALFKNWTWITVLIDGIWGGLLFLLTTLISYKVFKILKLK